MARLDVVDVDCTRNARDGVQLANIVLQVLHLMDAIAVALEIHLRQQPGLCSCLQSGLTVYREISALAAQHNAADRTFSSQIADASAASGI